MISAYEITPHIAQRTLLTPPLAQCSSCSRTGLDEIMLIQELRPSVVNHPESAWTKTTRPRVSLRTDETVFRLT